MRFVAYNTMFDVVVCCCRAFVVLLCRVAWYTHARTQAQGSTTCMYNVVDNSVDNFYKVVDGVVDKRLVGCGQVDKTRVRTLYPSKAERELSEYLKYSKNTCFIRVSVYLV